MNHVARSLFRILGALTVVGVVACSALLYYGAKGLCGNSEVARYGSPDGRSTVIVFQRDCGATTGFSTQASLVDAGDPLPESSGDLFIADTDHGAAPAAGWGGPELEVVWQGPRELLLRYDSRARVFRTESRVKGVDVRYAPILRKGPDSDGLQQTKPAQAKELRR